MLQQRFLQGLHICCKDFIAVLILICLCVATPATTAAEGQDSQNQRVQSLIERAQSEGTAPVIIQLNVTTSPEGELASDTAVLAQRDSIKTTQNRLLSKLSEYDVRRIKKFKYLPYIAMKLDSAGLEAALVDPNVVKVYEDSLSAPFLSESTPLIGATTAWSQGYKGGGQLVAVLDTGVDSSHSFLAGKVVNEACFSTNYAPYNATTVCPNGQESQVGSGAGAACSEPSGCDHGTHVAGIAAGTGASFSGVAPDADIIAIQVFSRFEGDICKYGSPCVLSFTSDQISALEHVYEQRTNFNIASVNMSLGGGHYSNACDNAPAKAAIDLLRSVGIATVISSGNKGYDDGISSPACISSAISVGSTTKSDIVSSFSNSAQILDLLAPGSNINSSVPGNGFSSKSGTSMAAPHVAGAFAVLRSKAPSATVDEILHALQTTGTTVVDSRNEIAKPRIQIDSALDAVGTSPAGGELTVSPEDGFSATGTVGGPFSPISKTYTITNTGSESIDFTVSESAAWASVSPVSGTLAPGGNRTITVSIDGSASSLEADDYVTSVQFANTTNGHGNTDRPLSLTVTGMYAVNDKFDDGIVLQQSSGSNEGSNRNASKEGGEPNHAGMNGGRSVWWRWTAPATGEVTFDTVGSNFDTLLGAYTGETVSELTTIAGNDDAEDLQSRITFETEAGTTYHIAVDGYGGANGDIVLNWDFTPDITPQDDIAVTPNTGFTTEGSSGGPFSPVSITYTLTNVSSSTRSFQIQNVPSWLTPSQTSGSLAPSQSTAVVLSVNTSADVLQPGNYTGEVLFNDISRSMMLTVMSVGVNNDNFSNAFPLTGTGISTTSSNVDASKETGEPDHGGNYGGRSVWWYWVAPSSEIVVINTFGSTFDTTLGVYNGSQVDNLTVIASNDDAGTGLQSQVSFMSLAGTTYYIAVDGFYGNSGAITLNLTLEPGGISNDNFNDAILLSGIPVSTTGSNFGASKEAGEPNHGGNTGGRSVWWRWTPPSSQMVTVDTFGSNFDTTLGLYTGTQLDSLTIIASNDDDNALQSRVSFSSVTGTTYYIAVDGYSGEAGDIYLNIAVAGSDNYTLQVFTDGSGSVASSPVGIDCPDDCAEDYLDGTMVVLTAIPASGGVFNGWSGFCSGTGLCTLSMSSDKSVTATFTEMPVLTVTTSGNGTVISSPPGINCGADCSESYTSGTTVTLTATPDTDWAFAGWTGACSGTGSCLLSLATSTNVGAIFSSVGQASVLLVDDDDNLPDVLSTYTEALDALGVTYDIWDTENSDSEPDAAELEQYQTVIWFTGYEWRGGFAGPGEAGETALASYLDGGGCFAISSQDYHYVRGKTSFMSKYLGVSSVTNDVGTETVTGTGPFDGLGPYTLSYPFYDYSDIINADGTAGTGFFGNQGNVVVYKNNGTYRTTFWGFPFEAISNAGDRMAVMDALLGYCGDVDTDGDGDPDSTDPDDDNDGMPDDWEEQYGLNPLVDDALEDLDGDGVSNIDEYNAGWNPTQPQVNQPELFSPIDNETDELLTPELRTGVFSDPDPDDTHTETRWQISTESDFSDVLKYVLDMKGDLHLTSLIVPDFFLNPDTTYYWRVKFYDNHNGASIWSVPYSFTTIPATDTQDTDQNGIPDDQENAAADLDGDGNLDLGQADIKSVDTVVGNARIGVKVSTNVTSIDAIKSIDPADISDTDGRPEDIPLGLISFKVHITSAGDTAEVTVYLSEPAPSNAKWYKYDTINGWQDYSEHATFSADRKSVTLELKDGGFGDADGAANGVIVDPSGLGTTSSSPEPTPTPTSSGGGGGGCFIATAVYGSQMEPHVKILREFRDSLLLNNPIGKAFVRIYYTYSPPIADFIAKHDNLRAVVRLSLLPIVGISWIALKIGPVYSLALMLLLCSVLIGFLGFRRKFKK